MEDWVHRALARWPNVPALYGWLSLDRRGRWRIQGELISRPQIVDTINANYAADERGCWYFQNGPQRGYVALETAPYVLHADGETLVTHNGLPVRLASAAWLDEEGSLLFDTEHGPAALRDDDLHWALARLQGGAGGATDEELLAAIAEPDGSATPLGLQLDGKTLPLTRLDSANAPARLGFVRLPAA